MGLLRLTHVRPEVAPATSVRETVKLMSAAEIGAIAVKDGAKLVGIFTERDLMRRAVALDRDLDHTPIAEVMTHHLVTVRDTTPVAEAIGLMRTRRIRHLIIIDEDGAYLGMLAQRHLLYDLTSELALKVDDLTGYLLADAPGG